MALSATFLSFSLACFSRTILFFYFASNHSSSQSYGFRIRQERSLTVSSRIPCSSPLYRFLSTRCATCRIQVRPIRSHASTTPQPPPVAYQFHVPERITISFTYSWALRTFTGLRARIRRIRSTAMVAVTGELNSPLHIDTRGPTRSFLATWLRRSVPFIRPAALYYIFFLAWASSTAMTVKVQKKNTLNALAT